MQELLVYLIVTAAALFALRLAVKSLTQKKKQKGACCEQCSGCSAMKNLKNNKNCHSGAN